MARLSRNSEDQPTIRGIVGPTNDCAWFKDRGELGFDVGVERGPVHRACDDPRRDQVVAGQPGDEGLGLPASERGDTEQPLSHWAAPAQPGHVRFYGGFVNEHKAVRFRGHARLTQWQPVAPGLLQVGPLAFLRDQAFFYMTIRPGPTPGGSRADRPAAYAFRSMRRTVRPTVRAGVMSGSAATISVKNTV